MPPTPQPAEPAARPHPAIILDAAHGGSDPGATLSDKIVEKDITLALARHLKRELEARGIICAMIRDSDLSIALADRASEANRSKAALYVAIHASSVSSGVRTFTAPVPQETRKPLQFLRVDAAQAPYVQASRAAASTISTELLKRDMPGVSAPGAVSPLSNIHLAAIAVEIAPPPHGSAVDLASASYQRSVAAALASALAMAHSRQAAP
jgi:N-acetylmuramoyl-L-alanine amidase